MLQGSFINWCKIKNGWLDYWLRRHWLNYILYWKVPHPHFRFASVCLCVTWLDLEGWPRTAQTQEAGRHHTQRKGLGLHISPGYRDHLQHHHHVLSCMFVYIQATQTEGAGGTNTTAPPHRLTGMRTIHWRVSAGNHGCGKWAIPGVMLSFQITQYPTYSIW